MMNEHGGDIYGRSVKLDFSANLNPLGMPENVRKAAAEAVGKSDRYPDPHCRELTEKLALSEKFPAENIVCGNGADDLIFRIVHALRPKRAVIAKPTFSEYAKALGEAGCTVAEYPPESICGVLDESVDMLILCNPNNPTGQLYDTELLGKISEKCSGNDIVFLCDECFIELCENPEMHSVRQFVNGNTIVLKAFTKTYAMAGLRLGYALFGSPGIAGKVRCCGQFWSVSSVAQAAGIAALDETQYVGNARKIIAGERAYLSGELRRYGFEVFPSDTDFILFRCGIPLDRLLLNEGIMIRNCGNYSGLGEGYFRIAVRIHEENEALIKAIEKVIKWQKT
ncbi:MAG: aminotransferase class I/II-fold pyridoxal phosphate-dependent enzyme [Ruminiclostridium sp.]|nr:aminotransferase class I/II-fold pyridoxal phosphate-dependent enzyme [Ruminiclostridium sp.]